MNIKASIYTLLCALAPLTAAYAQSVAIETADSMETAEAFNAKTDDLYFQALVARRHEDNSRARNLLREFITARPKEAAAHFELARIYADDKDMESAMMSIRKAIALDTTNKWYKETYANMLMSRKNYAEAAKIFAQLTRSEPTDADYPAKAAESYEGDGKREEALKYVDIALQRNIDDEELMQHKMQLYLDMNKPDKAGDVVLQMIAADPREGRYYRLLGDLYDNNNMYDKGTALYEQAIKKLPGDATVQVGIAAHYLKKGDTARYRTYLRKAVINPSIEPETQLELLSAYIQSLSDEGARAEALPLMAQLVAQNPGDATTIAFYGEVLEGRNMRDSAAIMYKRSLDIKPATYPVWGRLLGLYLDKPWGDSLIKYSEKAMRLFPNQAIIHFYNGVGHMNKNENNAAIKAINRAIDLQPDEEKDALTLMYSTLGDIYYTSKQYELSDKTFDKALILDPSNANVLNNYSYYLSERDIRIADAERMSKKALELRPEEGTYLDTYGWILYKKGDYKQAKVYIIKAIEAARETADGTLYNHLGNTLYKLNEKDKAIEAWKTAKEKGSDDANLDKKISEGKLYE